MGGYYDGFLGSDMVVLKMFLYFVKYLRLKIEEFNICVFRVY